MHLRVQPGAGHGGERPLAAVRPVRRRAERQSDPRPADQQVQRIRLRHHDQLRRSPRCHPVAQRLHTRQPRPAGFVQNGRLGHRPPEQSLKRAGALKATLFIVSIIHAITHADTHLHTHIYTHALNGDKCESSFC